MRTRGYGWLIGALVVAGLALAAPARAQGGQMRQGPMRQKMGSMEIQRLFDAYAVLQAQEALELDDEAFARFLPKLKALQETRRRIDVERLRTMSQLLRSLASTPRADDAALKDQVKALDDLDVRATAEVRVASDAIMQLLDPRRQAQFRVFEWQMERRKLELVSRARRNEAGRMLPEPR
jgi:hypothetical protein